MGVEIKVEELTKSFGKQLIWGDVTLTIPAGEVSVMLGPSGTGKSVFLKALIGLLKPDKGSIIIEGTDIASCPEKELYEIRTGDQINEQEAERFLDAEATVVLARFDDLHGRLTSEIAAMSDGEWAAEYAFDPDDDTLGERIGSLLGSDDGRFTHASAHLPDLRAYVDATRR